MEDPLLAGDGRPSGCLGRYSVGGGRFPRCSHEDGDKAGRGRLVAEGFFLEHK